MDSTEFTAMTLARSRQFNLKNSYAVAGTVEMLVLVAGAVRGSHPPGL